MNLAQRIARGGGSTRGVQESISLETWAKMFSLGGLGFSGIPQVPTQTLGEPAEEVTPDFYGLRQAYKTNGVIFACSLVRMLLFSETRFQYRRMEKGRPGNLWGDESLKPLETPWPGGSTRKLLARAIQDVDLAGSWFATKRDNSIFRLRPDWVTIIVGSKRKTNRPDLEYDAEIIGYLYHPGGRLSGNKPDAFTVEQVAHFAPVPDPDFKFRGMSWIQSVISELMADSAATTHKLKFFENGATPNLVVSLDPGIMRETFEEWIKAFEDQHEGYLNAWKTLYLGGGAKVDVVGANMRQISFKETQGHGETRIAAAAGVPPVIVGLSEGLQAATYSNYAQARRRFADGTMRPLWGDMAECLQVIVPPPSGSILWYDDRDISFLQEDLKDTADIQFVQAQALQALTAAGFTPESAMEMIVSDDPSLLKHTGLTSVQLLPPGTAKPSGNGGDPVSDPKPAK